MQKVCVSSVAFFAVSHAMAQVSGLVSIPIADMLGVREAEFAHSIAGTESKIDRRYFHSSSLTVGLTNWLEAAVETGYIERPEWAFKVKFLDDPQGKYAVSAGFNEINGGSSTPFVVGRYSFKTCRVHAGWERDDQSRFIFGVDFPINNSFTFGIDHRAGTDGATWAALYWIVPGLQGLSLEADFGLPNNHSDGNQHAFGATYGFRF